MGQEESHMASESASHLMSPVDNKTATRGQPVKQDAKVTNQARSMIKSCIARNDIKLLDELLSEDIYDINQIDKEKWLHKAVTTGQFDVVKTLVSHGININSQDKRGHTPMHIATQLKEHEAIRAIKELVKYGADINSLGSKSCGKTALHLAIEKEAVQVVNTLLECGCDPDKISECDKGISPLVLAAKGNNVEIFRLLLLHGANIHKCKVWKVTFNPPIDILTHRLKDKNSDSEKCLSMIKLLLQADCDLELTLTLMPQGNHSRGTGQGSKLNAVKTIVRRLEAYSKMHALCFLHLLIHNGHYPRGEEALAFASTFDPVVSKWLQDAQRPKSQIDQSVIVMRKNFKTNCHAAVAKLSANNDLKHLILNAGALESW